MDAWLIKLEDMDSEIIAQEKKDVDCENTAAGGGVHFVLVHGASHGAWCWYKVVELLEKDGHKVSAIDLKSAGTNPASADSIMSFEEYNEPLMHFLAKLPQTEKVLALIPVIISYSQLDSFSFFNSHLCS